MSDYLLDKNSRTATDVIRADLWGKEASRLKKWYFRWRYGRVLDQMPDVVAIRKAWDKMEANPNHYMESLVLWRNAKGYTIKIWRAGEGCRWRFGYYGNYYSSSLSEAFSGYDVAYTLEMASFEEAIGLLVR